jgi:hypothetical protein
VEFRFFCDESYDPPKTKSVKGQARLEPKCYIVGGMFGDQLTWETVARRWAYRNKIEKVKRYHAAHLNAGTWEYDGWGKLKRLKYSKQMLGILMSQKRKLHGLSCGVHVDSYRKAVSAEGQIKLGHPYIMCFNTLVATIATHMDNGGFAPDDTFSVVFDRNEFEVEAIQSFLDMKDNPKCPFRHRLETITPGSSEKFIGLQAADFVAYEMFRLVQAKRSGNEEMRAALKAMTETTGFLARLFDEKTLAENNDRVAKVHCKPNGCVIYPPYEWPPRKW